MISSESERQANVCGKHNGKSEINFVGKILLVKKKNENQKLCLAKK